MERYFGLSKQPLDEKYSRAAERHVVAALCAAHCFGPSHAKVAEPRDAPRCSCVSQGELSQDELSQDEMSLRGCWYGSPSFSD